MLSADEETPVKIVVDLSAGLWRRRVVSALGKSIRSLAVDILRLLTEPRLLMYDL